MRLSNRTAQGQRDLAGQAPVAGGEYEEQDIPDREHHDPRRVRGAQQAGGIQEVRRGDRDDDKEGQQPTKAVIVYSYMGSNRGAVWMVHVCLWSAVVDVM